MLYDITASLSARPAYTCVACGVIVLGDTANFNLTAVNNQALAIKLHTLHLDLPAYNMPVGWASYGNGIFRCPKHVV